MTNGTVILNPTKSNAFAIVGLIGVALLVLHAGRSLIGVYHEVRAYSVLNEGTSERYLRKEMAEENRGAYDAAIRHLSTAQRYDPLNASYPAALAELVGTIGRYGQVLLILNVQSSDDDVDYLAAMRQSIAYMRNATSRNPLDPHYHLFLGTLLMDQGDLYGGKKELDKTVFCAPHNAVVRYALSIEFLKSGLKDDAMGHAAVLARIDDTYRTFGERFYTSSYLYRALEIIWRATNGNIDSVLSNVPENEDGKRVGELFLLSKDLEMELEDQD